MTAQHPSRITLRDMHAYIGRQIEAGNADSEPFLDQRGLSFLEPRHYGSIAIGIPDDGGVTPGKVLFKAVF